jgi:hypothetical protein
VSVTPQDVQDAWELYDRLRREETCRREEWEEGSAAGGTDGTAAALFSRFYQAEQQTENAYLAWAQALRRLSRETGTFAGFGGPAFISGQYPVQQQPPSVI